MFDERHRFPPKRHYAVTRATLKEPPDLSALFSFLNRPKPGRSRLGRMILKPAVRDAKTKSFASPRRKGLSDNHLQADEATELQRAAGW